MLKRRQLIFAAALAGAISFASLAHAETKWDLPSAYPAFNFHVKNLEQFSADVKTETHNQLQISIHSGASLFKAPEIKRAVQGNQVQAGEFLMVNFQNEWPIFGVDGVPFLTSNYEDAFKLYQAQKPVLAKKLASQNMVLLYTVPWPPQGIYTKAPINSIADLKGKKWRAYSPTTARIAELIGAQPVTIQEAELSQALATGVVESLMTSGSTGADNKLYEYLKYYYNVQAWIPKNAIVMNKRAFDALDKETQAGLLKAAAAAETRGWEASKKENINSINKIKAGGITVIEPTEAMKAELKEVGKTILTEWSTKAGDDGKAVLDAYNKIK